MGGVKSRWGIIGWGKIKGGVKLRWGIIGWGIVGGTAGGCTESVRCITIIAIELASAVTRKRKRGSTVSE